MSAGSLGFTGMKQKRKRKFWEKEVLFGWGLHFHDLEVLFITIR